MCSRLWLPLTTTTFFAVTDQSPFRSHSWPPVVMAGARLRWRSRKDGLERLLVEAATADGETQHLPYLMGGRRLPLPLSPHLQVAA